MTLHIADTPLERAPTWPEPRPGGWHAAFDQAVFPAEGVDQILRRLTDPNVLVVTTGQQPGWLTGPLYTIHKALSARALARRLEQRWGRPVVPVFWVAGDDHDFAEASAASWIAADGSVVTDALPPRAPDAALTPMYREPVPSDVAGRLAGLAQAFSPGVARDQTLNWLARHYRPDVSLATAAGGAIAELVAPLGVICLDSTHVAVKRAAGPVILAALRQSEQLNALLGDRRTALEEAGLAPSVAVGGGATLAFLESNAGRDRLVRAGAAWVTRRSQERLTDMDVERIVRDEPQRLSPNVLLRPLVEAAILPTVAYVAGPGELRYLALAEALYLPLGIARQVPVPRWSGVLVETRVERALAKFNLSLPDILDPKSNLGSRIALAGLPAPPTQAVAALKAAIEGGYDRLATAIAALDPTLERTAGSARGSALSGLAELEKRVTQAQKRKDTESIAQVGRAQSAVLPQGIPQERMLTVASFLGRYGFGLLADLAAHIDSWYEAALEGDPGTV